MHWVFVNILDYVQYWTSSIPSKPYSLAYGCRPHNAACEDCCFVVTQETETSPVITVVILHNKDFINTSCNIDDASKFYEVLVSQSDWVPLIKNELIRLGIDAP